MKKYLFAGAMALAVTSPALAGPFILAGTDADDHGSASATTNIDGWLFMQKALENIGTGAGLTNRNKTVTALGSNGEAADAITSAFSLSSLASNGWSLTFVEGATDIASFLQGGSLGTSILYMDSGSNVPGGITSTEQAAIDANASFINSFLGAGGGLFSQAQDYGWLSALIPGLTVTENQQTGIDLTAAGFAAFPGLTNSDLNAGPHHQYFTNTGVVPILGVGSRLAGPNAGRAIILGGAGGSITNPTPIGAVPESSTWMMMIAGFGLTGAAIRYRRRRTSVSFG